MRGGTFITLEGGDGSGKTTLIRAIERKLQEIGHEVRVTREPGGSPIAEAIRNIILGRENTAMDPRTEALLYAAARRQHLAEKVMPALEQGIDVICDRFVDSSLVYQGIGRGIGLDPIWDINRFATEGCMPNLTIYLDIDPEIGLKRIEANENRELNRLDLESLNFHRRVREGYLRVAEQFKDRIVTLDASVPAEVLAQQAWTIIEAKLNLNAS
ncbi:dTMP kinase [Cohnella yongneupensis]|uniref:Thymidylate kinase n=1 Tax=Cohnella yongneupensis TaxID=425006 RepID=A0ABW0QYH3_9BACL